MTSSYKKTPRAVAGYLALLALSACSTVPETTDPQSADHASGAKGSRSITSTRSLPNEADPAEKASQNTARAPSRDLILINYFGGIDAANTGFLVKTILAEMANGESNFQININSIGGDPNYAIAAYNLLKNLPITITTYNVNQVESAAVYLYCTGKQRYAHPRSIFTIHSVKWSLTGYSPAKIADISKKIDLQQANIKAIFQACMSVDPGEIERHLYGDNDWYLQAREAYRKGLVHGMTPEGLKPKKVYLISDGYKG